MGHPEHPLFAAEGGAGARAASSGPDAASRHGGTGGVAGWAAAVLCGGASARMGSDKAVVEIDGVPMLRRVALALRTAGAHQVVAVGSGAPLEMRLRRRALDGLAIDLHPDDHPGSGPLAGVLTALRLARHDIVAVVACDLLTPSTEAIRATVAGLRRAPGADVAVPTTYAEAPPQWLHAAWRRGAAERLRAPFDLGERALHRAVVAAGLTVTWVEGLDDAALADVDLPDDLPDDQPPPGAPPRSPRR